MPQNPIQKAHLEGKKKLEEEWADLYDKRLSHKQHGVMDVFWLANEFITGYSLTTYAESILNAALEAGPGKMKHEGILKNLYIGGWNDCHDSISSALNEGIKLIK